MNYTQYLSMTDEERQAPLRKRAERLEAALLAIRQHVEESVPTGYRMSAVWNIADRAIRDEL